MRTKKIIMEELAEHIESSKVGSKTEISVQEQVVIELLLDIRGLLVELYKK